jgi:pilus assembly protein Flp/PilA
MKEEVMRKVLDLARSFGREENGVALIEYTVLLGIITVAVIATIIAVGAWVTGQWTALNAVLPAAAGS